jgi:hypothetical protein
MPKSLPEVISNTAGLYVSGYWIEPASGAEPDEHTRVYNLVADVKKLERRIRRKREREKAVILGGVIAWPNKLNRLR